MPTMALPNSLVTSIVTPALPTTTLTPTYPQLPASPVVQPTVLTTQTTTPVDGSLSRVEEVSAPVVHVVVAGDTLYDIALHYDTTVAAITAANHLTGDLIYPDQVLAIPGVPPFTNTIRIPTPIAVLTLPVALHTPLSTPQPDLGLPFFSILSGDLASAYAATVVNERFTLHYTINPFPAQDPKALATLVQQALDHHEQLLKTRLAGTFDVYVAGTLFTPPDQELRGRSFSNQRRFFFLDDGSGNQADTQYIAAHELIHLLTWNTFGAPSSVMLSEGVAVYAGMDFIATSEHLPLALFCAAYQQVGMLPRISSELSYQGHIRDLENYYAAGCFVQYLIEQYGPDKFAQVYPTSDYGAIYGKSLTELEAEWQAQGASSDSALLFDAKEFVGLVSAVEAAYTQLFTDFSGTPAEMIVYQQVDAARIALLQGDLDAVKAYVMKQAR